MGWLSDIFDPGKKQREEAAANLKRAEFTGGSVTGPAGLGASTTFGRGGQAQLTGSLGAFEPFLMQLLGQTGAQFGQPAFDPGLQQDFQGLGSIFSSALPMASADPRALGAEISAGLRPGLERAQGTLRNTTFDRLFSSGQSAVSSAASPILEGLQRTFAEQNQALDVTGLNLAQGLQQGAFGRALGASQGRNAIQDLMMRLQMEQQGLGLQSLGAATGLAQLPLAFQNAIMGAGQARTSSLLGAGQGMGQLAAQAKSPFLEALTAAGGFASGLGSLGFAPFAAAVTGGGKD